MSEQLNQHLQDSLLYLSITDTEFLKLIIGQVQPSMFTSRVSEFIAKICFRYFAQYKEAPTNHFQDEIIRNLEDSPEAWKEECVTYVKKLEKITDPNKDYVVKRVSDFIKQRTLEDAAIDFAEKIAVQDFTGAEQLMYSALKAGIHKQESGLNYLDDLSGVSSRADEKTYLMDTGIGALNYLLGGFNRGQVVCLGGGYKGRKTWGLQHFAGHALKKGLNVIVFSHEVSEEELELRFDMMFSARGTHEAGVGRCVTVPFYDKKNKKLVMEDLEVRSVYDTEAVARVRKAVARRGGRLIIKKYPMGQCSMQEMERFLNYLETYENFVPDVLVTDYVEIMDIENGGSEMRHKIDLAYKTLKGIADERNILAFTASQITANALNKKNIAMKDMAEDKRKAGNVDILLAISGSDEQQALNMGQITILANRSGSNQGESCGISFCTDIGQFCLSSWLDSGLEEEFLNMYSEFE